MPLTDGGHNGWNSLNRRTDGETQPETSNSLVSGRLILTLVFCEGLVGVSLREITVSFSLKGSSIGKTRLS